MNVVKATTGTATPVTAVAMTTTALYRMSGLTLITGCGVMAIGDFLRVISGPDPASVVLAMGWFIQFVGAAIAVLALPGLCAGIARSTRVLGVAGLVGIAIFLFYFGIFGGLLHALAVPDLLAQGATRPHPVDIGFLVSAIFAMLGSVALGVAFIRGRDFSRSSAVLLIVGGVALVVGHPIAHVEDVGLLLMVGGLGLAGYRLAFGSARAT